MFRKLSRCGISVGLFFLTLTARAEAQTPVFPLSKWPESPNQFINVDKMSGARPTSERVLKSIATDPFIPSEASGKLNGFLTYTPIFHPDGDEGLYGAFALRHLGSGNVDSRSPVAYYGASNGSAESLFEAQFSPGGDAISYKAGRMRNHGMYQIYVWDLMRRTVIDVTDVGNNVHYPNYYWGPRGDSIAYIQGGDEHGLPLEYGPIGLMVTDVKTGRQQGIASDIHLLESDQLFYTSLAPFSWSSPQTLLYAKFIKPQPKAVSKSRMKSKRRTKVLPPKVPQRHTAIFESRIGGKAPQKITEDGYAPLASPDNKWIAFLRPVHSPFSRGDMRFEWGTNRVLLYNRSTKAVVDTKIKLDIAYDLALKWTPDSKKMVVFFTGSAKGDRLGGEVRVHLVEVSTLRVNSLPPWYFDIPDGTYSDVTAKQITRDGRYLVLNKNTTTGEVMKRETTQTFLILDLSSGKVEKIGDLTRVILEGAGAPGWDWLDSPR